MAFTDTAGLILENDIQSPIQGKFDTPIFGSLVIRAVPSLPEKYAITIS
jgi:hypothetical protein